MAGKTMRGIDHIGLTVPDIKIAEAFLINGLGAEFIYEMLGPQDPPLCGAAVERAVNVPAGTLINVIRMYKLGTGPGIELFQYTTDQQRQPPARGCDFGWQHIAVYVDDIQRALARALDAGAERLCEPWTLMNSEQGEGNQFCFMKAPFGALVELITYPSPQAYESMTSLRRWKPPA